jgi:hypothetical protein
MWEPQIVLPGERGTRLLWAAATAKKTASIAQSTFVVSMMLLLVSDKSFMWRVWGYGRQRDEVATEGWQEKWGKRRVAPSSPFGKHHHNINTMITET